MNTSPPQDLTPDQSFLHDMRQRSPGLASVRDSTLIVLGTEFCAKLRAGVPARQVMQNTVESISSKYLSGQITDSQQKDLIMGMADVDRKATEHYCPEQSAQVLRAFAQMAGGN